MNLFVDGNVALVVNVPQEEIASVGGKLTLIRVTTGNPTKDDDIKYLRLAPNQTKRYSGLKKRLPVLRR